MTEVSRKSAFHLSISFVWKIIQILIFAIIATSLLITASNEIIHNPHRKSFRRYFVINNRFYHKQISSCQNIWIDYLKCLSSSINYHKLLAVFAKSLASTYVNHSEEIKINRHHFNLKCVTIAEKWWIPVLFTSLLL